MSRNCRHRTRPAITHDDNITFHVKRW
jgi:hypothetical protein